MTQLHSSFNFQQWVIESDFPDYQQFEYLFDGLEDNRDDMNTHTNNGIQHYYEVDEIDSITNTVRQRANEILQEQNAPMRVGNADSAWTITYGPGGWQALHNHAYRHHIITTVLYFDTNESNNMHDGAFYSMFSEPNGDQFCQVFPYWAGKFILAEGAMFHGAYPTTTTRRTLVIDFIPEYINNDTA